MGSAPVSPLMEFWLTSTPVHRVNDNRYFECISPVTFSSFERKLELMAPAMHKRSTARNMHYTNRQRTDRWKPTSPIKSRSVDNNFINSNNINSQNSKIESSPGTFSMNEMMKSLTDIKNNVNSDVNCDSNSLSKSDEMSNSMDIWYSPCKSIDIIYEVASKEKMLNDDNNNEVNKDINEHSSNFDILMELRKRNCYAILSNVLSYISDKDIENFKNVNKQWEQIVSEDDKATKRLSAFYRRRMARKENLSKRLRRRRHESSVLLSPMNSSTEASLKSSRMECSDRFNSFMEVTQNLKPGVMLRKCLICQYPAVPKDENKYCCSQNACQFTFCSLCLSPRVDNMRHTCKYLGSLEDEDIDSEHIEYIGIGSKRSKKNLRRVSSHF